jgi:hypothetical protein
MTSPFLYRILPSEAVLSPVTNMAGTEPMVINNYGLSARIAVIERWDHKKRKGAWNRRGHGEACKIERRFTDADARINLKRFYLQFE